MDMKHLSLLRNPFNHEALEIRETPGGTFLAGSESGELFRIKDGIPVFIDTDKLTEADAKSRRFYDILSPFYEFTQSIYFRVKGGEAESRNEYLRFVDVRPGDKVLEVSIGNGVNVRHLPRTAEYFGIDVSWGQLKRCLASGSRYGFDVEVYQGEAERLPFRDEAFDVVFNVGSINYFEDKAKAIDEMFRVAKPGARMMIADETEKAARSHNKLPIYRGFFNSSEPSSRSPRDYLPKEAEGVKLTEIRDGLYFCLQFRKGK